MVHTMSVAVNKTCIYT